MWGRKGMLGVVSKLGLYGEISGPGCMSDSRRTGLSVSQHGASIKHGRAWTRSSAGGSTEKKTASSHHILRKKMVPSESVRSKMRGGGRRKSSPYLRTRGTSAQLPVACMSAEITAT